MFTFLNLNTLTKNEWRAPDHLPVPAVQMCGRIVFYLNIINRYENLCSTFPTACGSSIS